MQLTPSQRRLKTSAAQCERCNKQMQSVQWGPSGSWVVDHHFDGKTTTRVGEFERDMCDGCEQDFFDACEVVS